MSVRNARATAAVAAVLLVVGCSHLRWPVALLGPPSFEQEESFVAKPFVTYRVAADAQVIGEVGRHRVRAGESLFEIARYYDLGYNELVEANPGIEPLVPPVGAEVVLPTQWVLPCCATEGVVVNIPEMRLYYYRRAPDAPGTLLVQTYPVGLGRQGWRTPRGRYSVKTKTVNPRWNIPESIRQEHIRERGDDRRFIAGGAPDNPLGKYRLTLSRHPYSIHGTDVPWGIGMEVTHGCIRLYPEDIERFYRLVDVGTPVELAYQPVKAGRRGAEVYVEVHRDIYGYAGSPYRAALAALGQRQLGDAVDREALAGLLKTSPGASPGVPRRVPAASRAS